MRQRYVKVEDVGDGKKGWQRQMMSLRESERDGGAMVTAMVGNEGDDVDRSEDNETRGKEFRKMVAAQQARNRRTDKHTENKKRGDGAAIA